MLTFNTQNNKANIFLGPSFIEKHKCIRSLASKILSSTNTKEIFYTLDERLDEFSHLDYFEITKNNLKEEEKSTVTVDEIRDLIDFTRNKSFYSGYKVALIDSLNNLNNNAANALLKILEEPPSGCFIFLTASNLLNIPATIKSRCNIIRFLPKKSLQENGISQRFNEYFNYKNENNFATEEILDELKKTSIDLKQIAQITKNYNTFSKAIDASLLENLKVTSSEEFETFAKKRQQIMHLNFLAEKLNLNKEDVFLVVKNLHKN